MNDQQRTTAIETAKQRYADLQTQLSSAKKVAFEEMSKYRHQTALAKVPAVVNHLIDSLGEGPVVCFAHHRDVIDQIIEGVEAHEETAGKDEYGKVVKVQPYRGRVVQITGDTSATNRQEAVDRFQNGSADLFVGNILAAGVGITLTRSSHVVFAELDWVPGQLSQAEDRCHRIGQAESVLVQHLVLQDSVDSIMVPKLITKQAVIDAALDDVGEEETPVKVEKIKSWVEVENKAIDKAKKESEGFSDERNDAILSCLRALAGVCDGARAKDNCGFNGSDSHFGKSLAARDRLSPRQAQAAALMLVKYKRQLPEGIYKIATKGKGNESQKSKS